MKHIRIPYQYLDYPIGSSVNDIVKTTANYKAGFRYLKYCVGTKINLWCRGSSGAMFAMAFALQFPQYNFKIVYVRKDGESSHFSRSMPYSSEDVINVIIDDFMSSGQTVIKIMEYISEWKLKPHILILSSMSCNFKFRNQFEYIITSSNIEPV